MTEKMVGDGFAFNRWFLFNSDEQEFPHFCRDTDCQPCIQEARRQWRVNSR